MICMEFFHAYKRGKMSFSALISMEKRMEKLQNTNNQYIQYANINHGNFHVIEWKPRPIVGNHATYRENCDTFISMKLQLQGVPDQWGLNQCGFHSDILKLCQKLAKKCRFFVKMSSHFGDFSTRFDYCGFPLIQFCLSLRTALIGKFQQIQMERYKSSYLYKSICD